LRKAEDDAREDKAGLWGDGSFAVRSPEDLRKYSGTVQILEGEVLSASLNTECAYIHFGPDFKTDIPVMILQNDSWALRRAKFDVKGLARKRLRVRGGIQSDHGPEIEIVTPAATEMLASQK
jgi:micrococcal nuclease